MKKDYLIIVDVTRATGTCTYRVRAESIEAARAMWDAGDAGECLDEQLEAEELGAAEIIEDVE